MSEASVGVPDGADHLASAASFAALADRGWAALERERVFGWQTRFAGGVTKRANSAWAAGADAAVSAEAFAAIEARYRARGLPPCFQLSSGDEATLRLLSGRGYRAVDETLVLAASVPPSRAMSPEVEIGTTPSDEWLACWWAVDGRGGAAELEVARRIMLGTPSLYAALRVSGTLASVARLAVVGSWGGLFCVATLPEQRRRGHSATVVGALLAAGAASGVTDAWLQVLANNAGAIALYSTRFGFRERERYRYLVDAARVPLVPGVRDLAPHSPSFSE